MTLRDEIIDKLIKAKIPSPRLEADIILKNAAPNYPEITIAEKEKVFAMLNRRVDHEPLDKIIGYKEFYKYTFKVNQNVLSPRPDTEILVENALELIPVDKAYKMIDFGTGSGCILLSILKERPLMQGIGVDISAKALSITGENAKSLGVENQVQFINSDWNELSLQPESFDVITSNPPYIESKEIQTLEKEVKDFDPMIALDGGEDGLTCYRDIAEISENILKNDGLILLEVGYNQAKAVADIFIKKGFKLLKIAKDLANIERCIILKK